MDRNPHAKIAALLLLLLPGVAAGSDQTDKKPSFEEYIRTHVPARREIDVFLNEMSWAQFDPEVGYILGNFMPRDGIDGSSTFSTVQPDGTRTSFMYQGKPCRIANPHASPPTRAGASIAWRTSDRKPLQQREPQLAFQPLPVHRDPPSRARNGRASRIRSQGPRGVGTGGVND